MQKALKLPQAFVRAKFAGSCCNVGVNAEGFETHWLWKINNIIFSSCNVGVNAEGFETLATAVGTTIYRLQRGSECRRL
jgi:hypothetical protein